MSRCLAELCANWTGDGCACRVFGIDPVDASATGAERPMPEGASRTPHPEPHSMNGALRPEEPPSCDCECSRCWVAYDGACLCADCQDPHHNHSQRARTDRGASDA